MQVDFDRRGLVEAHLVWVRFLEAVWSILVQKSANYTREEAKPPLV